MSNKQAKVAHAGPKAGNLFTIPQTSSFLDVLAGAIIKGALPSPGKGAPSPLELTGYTLLVPSRRAVRAMRDAFFRVGGSPAMLLPQIRALGDVDETQAVLTAMGGADGGTAQNLRPAIGELERRLVLTEFVRKWGELMYWRAR